MALLHNLLIDCVLLPEILLAFQFYQDCGQGDDQGGDDSKGELSALIHDNYASKFWVAASLNLSVLAFHNYHHKPCFAENGNKIRILIS